MSDQIKLPKGSVTTYRGGGNRLVCTFQSIEGLPHNQEEMRTLVLTLTGILEKMSGDKPPDDQNRFKSSYLPDKV